MFFADTFESFPKHNSKNEVLRVKSLKQSILQEIKESSKFGNCGPPSGIREAFKKKRLKRVTSYKFGFKPILPSQLVT